MCVNIYIYRSCPRLRSTNRSPYVHSLSCETTSAVAVVIVIGSTTIVGTAASACDGAAVAATVDVVAVAIDAAAVAGNGRMEIVVPLGATAASMAAWFDGVMAASGRTAMLPSGDVVVVVVVDVSMSGARMDKRSLTLRRPSTKWLRMCAINSLRDAKSRRHMKQ